MTRNPDQCAGMQLEFNFPAYSQREDYIAELDFAFHLRKNQYERLRGKVKAETLAAVLGHIGKYRECFESQERICKRLKIDDRKLQRAIAVLRDLDILITERKAIGRGRVTVNHHRINWEQVRRMIDDQHQPDSSVALIDDKTSDQSDSTGTINPTVLTDQPDSTDVINPTVLTLTLYRKKKENELKESTYHSLATAVEDKPQDLEEVVVSALVDMGMSPDGSRMSVRAAIRRGLDKPAMDAHIALYRQLDASPHRDPKMHIGWLSRWLDGKSKPPEQKALVPDYEQQSRTASKEFVQRETLRRQIVQAGRKAKAPEELIQQRLREAGIPD